MSHSICGLDCTVCDSKGSCGGCVKTNGRPFQGAASLPPVAKRKDLPTAATVPKPTAA